MQRILSSLMVLGALFSVQVGAEPYGGRTGAAGLWRTRRWCPRAAIRSARSALVGGRGINPQGPMLLIGMAEVNSGNPSRVVSIFTH